MRHKTGLEARIAQLQARQIEVRRKAVETVHLDEALDSHLDKIVGQLEGLIRTPAVRTAYRLCRNGALFRKNHHPAVV